MVMTNLEIYSAVDKLGKNFDGTEKMPIKLNFIFQKNNKILMDLVKDIEASRMSIGEKYGEQVEGGYTVPAENIEAANKEYSELMEIEQEVNIMTISIDKLPEDLVLTTAQMDALSFMITE